MSISQYEKAVAFRALHAAPGAFVIPNPWDAGSARMLAGMGFSALATSSWAAAGTAGLRDGDLGRDEALRMAGSIAAAVDIPVAGDLENGYGDAPEFVAETIRLAAEAGLVGGSIEDATGRADDPLYEIGFATERVAAAVAAARKLPFPFTLTARAENFVRGRPDLDDTIARLQAYERAGADVLFAPGLPDLATAKAVCAAVSKPVNFMNGTKGRAFPVAALAEAGVKRISLATVLYRAAMTALHEAATEIVTQGTFVFVERPLTGAEVAKYFRSPAVR